MDKFIKNKHFSLFKSYFSYYLGKKQKQRLNWYMLSNLSQVYVCGVL